MPFLAPLGISWDILLVAGVLTERSSRGSLVETIDGGTNIFYFETIMAFVGRNGTSVSVSSRYSNCFRIYSMYVSTNYFFVCRISRLPFDAGDSRIDQST